jgi:hypothetical protein
MGRIGSAAELDVLLDLLDRSNGLEKEIGSAMASLGVENIIQEILKKAAGANESKAVGQVKSATHNPSCPCCCWLAGEVTHDAGREG